jgi:hypothetical protein
MPGGLLDIAQFMQLQTVLKKEKVSVCVWRSEESYLCFSTILTVPSPGVRCVLRMKLFAAAERQAIRDLYVELNDLTTQLMSTR